MDSRGGGSLYLNFVRRGASLAAENLQVGKNGVSRAFRNDLIKAGFYHKAV